MKQTTLFATSAALLVLSTHASLAAKSAQDFIMDAILGDNSEIVLGQLAQQKGGEKVKSFGQMLVTDHTMAKQQASDLAKTLGATPSSEPTKEAKDEQGKLSSLSGDAFDHEFATYMVTDHQKDIAEFQEEAKANDGPTSMLAAKQLPTLQAHLRMAQSLAAGGSASNTPPASNAGSLTQQEPGTWRASKLPGVDIYGSDNKKVGDITDVLVGKDGKAEYIIVGVGGFLGLGQKDIAVPFDKVRFTDQPMGMMARDANATASGTPAGPGTAGGGIAPNTTTGLGVPADTSGGTNGSAAPGVAMAPAAASMVANRNMPYPDHGMIDLTADQLKAAPAFQFLK